MYGEFKFFVKRLPAGVLVHAALHGAACADPEAVQQALIDATTPAETALAEQTTEARDRLRQVFDAAADELDGYIKGRYPKLTTPPDTVKVLHLDIAVYRLLLPADKDAPEARTYDYAIKYLTKVAAGTIDLPGVDAPGGAPAGGAEIAVKGAPVFTRQSLGPYIRDTP